MSPAVWVVGGGAACGALALFRSRRRRGPAIRLLVEPYRNDRAGAEALAATFTTLHGLLGPRRTLVLEVHLDRRPGGAPLLWFALQCPGGLERHVQAALRASYPNVRLRAMRSAVSPLPATVRLHRRTPPRAGDELPEGAPGIEPLLAAMAAAGAPATLRLLMRPAHRVVEHVCSASEEPVGPLLWCVPLIMARDPARARAIASAICSGDPRLRARRAGRVEGMRIGRSPRCLYRPSELARMWCLPAPEFAALPYLRRAVPLAPAPPGISRSRDGGGLLRDEHGPVTIAVALRRQHTAVVGAVDQGKTSFLVSACGRISGARTAR